MLFLHARNCIRYIDTKPGISEKIEAYIQSRDLKKTLESLTFEQRRGPREVEEETTEPKATETRITEAQANSAI